MIPLFYWCQSIFRRLTMSELILQEEVVYNTIMDILSRKSLIEKLKEIFNSAAPDLFYKRDPEAILLAVRRYSNLLHSYFKAEFIGFERICSGPALFVGNHNSLLLAPEALLFYTAIFERRGLDDYPYGLGHRLVTLFPPYREMLLPHGVVEATPENASRLLRRGHKVLVYPGGERDAFRPFRRRNQIEFGGRTGFLKVAIKEQIPIIPVVAAGAHNTCIVIDDLHWLLELFGLDCRFNLKAWPITLCLPWGISFGPPPVFIPFPTKITIEIMDPIWFNDVDKEACENSAFLTDTAEQIRISMQNTLERLSTGKDYDEM